MLRPAPIWPTIMPTVTRWPRIQGLPPIIAGSWVIREKSLMSHLGGGDAIRRLYLNRGPVARPTRGIARRALGRESAVKRPAQTTTIRLSRAQNARFWRVWSRLSISGGYR